MFHFAHISRPTEHTVLDKPVVAHRVKLFTVICTVWYNCHVSNIFSWEGWYWSI